MHAQNAWLVLHLRALQLHALGLSMPGRGLHMHWAAAVVALGLHMHEAAAVVQLYDVHRSERDLLTG